MNEPAGPIRTEAERNLALLAYGLLFVSPFFAGTTALVAVIIAYFLYDAANDQLAGHFRNQRRIFWVTFILVVLCILSSIALALFMIKTPLGHDLPRGDSGAWHVDAFDRMLLAVELPKDSGLTWGHIFGLAAVASGVGGFLWVLTASAIGFIRLASTPHLGHSGRK